MQEASLHIGKKDKTVMIRKFKGSRPSGLTTMAIIVLLGAFFSLFLLLFAKAGSGDFYFLVVDASVGFITSYAIWTLQPWGFWFTAAYETYEIAYSLFLLTQHTYWNLYIALPIGGVIASGIGLAYIFLDRTVKPAFNKVAP